MIKRGFSLMEMMVVMLIVAVIAAASAPMISKKMVQNASSDSPWIWTSATNNSIAFNLKGSDSSPATIGATKPPIDENTMFHIHTKNINNPIMSFSVKKNNTSNDVDKLLFQTGNDSLQITDELVSTDSFSTGHTVFGKGAKVQRTTLVGPLSGNESIRGGSAIGYNAKSGNAGTAVGANAEVKKLGGTAFGYKSIVFNTGGVAIGSYSTAEKESGIAIGGSNENPTMYDPSASYAKTTAKGEASIAIGKNATAHAEQAIAIGSNAGDKSITPETNDFINSISVGCDSMAKGKNSIAIGTGAKTSAEKSIVIGNGLTDKHTTPNILIGTDSIATNGSIVIGESLKAISTGSTNGICIGEKLNASNGIAIGHNIGCKDESDYVGGYSVAIGSDINTGWRNANSVSIGYKADTTTQYSVAIGYQAKANGEYDSTYQDYATAVGAGAEAKYSKSTAIGYNAKTTHKNQLVLGDEHTTVYIPGRLMVEKDTFLAVGTPASTSYDAFDGSNYRLYFRTMQYSTEDRNKIYKIYRRDNSGAKDDLHVHDSMTYTKKEIEDKIYFVPSDRRLKDVGEVFKGGLEEIKKLEVFNYTFKKDPNKTHRVGVMAQDLEKIFPKAVFKGDDGFLRIRMEDMFYALVNAVKELDSKIDSILSDVKTALNDIVDLKKKSAEYEKTISILVEQNKAQDKAIRDLEKRLAKLEKKMDKASKKSEVIEEVEE